MKSKKKTSLWTGSFIILLLIFTPYLLYVHQNIPESIENYQTFLGTIKGGYYGKVQTYIYFLLAKFVPLALLTIWFLTNKHWWVHAIIIPISVYLFQLISVINDSEAFVDEVDFKVVLYVKIPLTVVLPYIYITPEVVVPTILILS